MYEALYKKQNKGTDKRGVIQCYKLVRTLGGEYVQSKPLPGKEERNIMVKKGEPGTVYITKGTPTPAELIRLGIKKNGTVIQNPDPEGPNVLYKQLSQSRLPYLLENDSRAYFRKQSRRSPEDTAKASTRLQVQINFLDQMLAFADNIQFEWGQASINEQNFDRIKDGLASCIKGSYGNADSHSVENSVVGALGTDILMAVYALYEIAVNNSTDPLQRRAGHFAAGASIQEQKIVFELAVEELRFRRRQAEWELQCVGWKPQMRTGCDVSAADRSLMMFGINHIREKADFEKLGFQREINWNYHFASYIDVGSLTSDTLYIEDAVGKTYDGNERANAHWFAHIYGTDERIAARRYMAQVQGDLQAGALGSRPKVADCRFNRLKSHSRRNCLGAAIQPGSCWKLHFIRGLSDRKIEYTGFLVVSLNDKHQFTYQFCANRDQIFTAAQQDFLMKTADEVVDSFIMREFALSGYLHENPGANGDNNELYSQMKAARIHTRIQAGRDFVIENIE